MLVNTLLLFRLLFLASWGLADESNESNDTTPYVQPHVPPQPLDDMSDAIDFANDVEDLSPPWHVPYIPFGAEIIKNGKAPIFKIVPTALDLADIDMGFAGFVLDELISAPGDIWHMMWRAARPWIFEAILDFINSDKNIFNQNKVKARIMNKLIAQCSEAFPERNCLIHHTQSGVKPVQHLLDSNTHHEEYQLESGPGFGVELIIFSLGYFKRDGDGGIVNWAFNGNYSRFKDSPEVLWEPITTLISYVTPDVWEHPIVYIPYSEMPEMAEPTGNPIVNLDPSEIHYADNPERRKRAASTLPTWNSGIHRGAEFQSAPKPDANDPASFRTAPEWESTPERTHRPAAAKAKRDFAPNDGSYFVYCKNASDSAAASSGVAYYRDLQPGANKGQLPDDFVWVTENHGDLFRMSVGAAEFRRAAAAVEWSVWGHAMDDATPVGEVVGMANDGLDHFWMYKDDGAELFETDEYKCFSEYYAF